MAPPPSLRILLVGSGGREHALAWKLSQSPLVESITVVPGNGGTAACPRTANDSSVAADDYPGLVALATSRGINLVVPGPEAPLVDGIADFFSQIGVGIPVFGPSKAAARLEGSKAFSKDFMKRHAIPTAAYKTFTDHDAAVAYVNGIGHDVVIKASGLAAGKGVVIPATKREALDALGEIMVGRAFGAAGDEVVVEEYLSGEELSILSFCDGCSVQSFPPAQDHKRILDGDRGPNTGGMGCYSPTRVADKALVARIESEILLPTVRGMRREGHAFTGVLFTGLMITAQGPKVLEYNVRFGDPEIQTVLPLLSPECDLAAVMLACTRTCLDSVQLAVEPRFSATVVAAAAGYPGSYAKGTPVRIGSTPAGVTVFHAGTTPTDGGLRTCGGRVLAVNATADTLEAAVRLAYAGVGSVEFEGMYYRKDIAHRALGAAAAARDRPARESLTYASAGVSIDAGNDFVERIKRSVASTRRPGADAEIGGFGGEIDLAQCGLDGLPVLVGAIDGVGTKLMIAQAMGKHRGVGIDLVAMNVNDLVVQGAEPLMFLDYYGCSKLNLASAADFVDGVAAGCREAGCALVGGETAEMPGMYRSEDYDAAGAAIGAVAKAHRLPRLDAMREGDVLVGLASSGVHSNGFSLVRRIVDRAGLAWTDPAPWNPAASVGDSLLTPTRIYVKPLLPLVKSGVLKGMAHITGGGLVDNVPRMLPEHLSAEIDVTSWPAPSVFRWLRSAGNVAPAEMCRTFNNGIGMVVVVDAADVDAVAGALWSEEGRGGTATVIGRLVPRTGGSLGCDLKNLDEAVWA